MTTRRACPAFFFIFTGANKYMSQKSKKKRESSFQAAKRLQRKLAMQQGFYDGRFKEKVIKDKKKEAEKNKARKKVTFKEED